jgi:hypothetical protein
MPLSLIQSVLGLSFMLIWVFIGTMILRDRLHAIRGEQTLKDERTPAPRRARAPRNLREKVVQPGNSSRRRRDATAA